MNELIRLAADNLTKAYLDNIAFRGLMQLNPITAILDLSISSKYSDILVSRNEAFFRQLEIGELEYSIDVIESNDFLHCFFISYNAAMRANKEEKIELFAKVLKNQIQNSIVETDEFEEFIQIIEDISYREFLILSKIHSLELQFPLGMEDDDNDLKRTIRFWDNVDTYMNQSLNIPYEEQESILIRLSRTGLYITFRGLYYSDTKGKGKTTNLFKRLSDIIKS